MFGTLMKSALAGVMAIALVAPADAGRRGDKAAALVGGVLLGAIVASAASRSHRHENQYDRAPDYRRGAPFSPQAGIICYPRELACYDSAGDFSLGWTRRTF